MTQSVASIDSGNMTVSVRDGTVIVRGRRVAISPGATFAVIVNAPWWLAWLPWRPLLRIEHTN